MKKLIQQVIEFSKKSSGKDSKKNHTSFSNFVEVFFAQSKISDFENYSVESLFDSAESCWQFLRTNRSKGFNIRIYNPKCQINDLEWNQTLVEIINSDMPFLVDSVVSFLDKHGVKINNLIHPVLEVTRDSKGDFVDLADKKKSLSPDFTVSNESAIQLHLEKISNESEIKVLQSEISKILSTVAIVVEDWQSMCDLVKKAGEELIRAKTQISNENKFNEIKHFIDWIIGGNFILLGAKEFNIEQDSNSGYSLVEINSGSGIFRSELPDVRPKVINSSPSEVADSVLNPYFIEIVKSRYRCRIHRNVNAERIRIQRLSAEGKVIGEFRFIGLFTSSAYFSSIFSIPLIRNKALKVIANSGYEEGSHNYKDLISTLESYPRDELFQINEEDLLKNATGIVAIAGRSLVKFFARNDKFRRFVSCLIFTPRDRSNSEIREKIKAYLCEIYRGEVADSFVQITDSNLIRFHLIIRTPKPVAKVDEAAIERDLHKMTLVWNDLLFEEIKQKFSNEKRVILNSRYKNAFSISYTNRFDPSCAVIDIEKIESSLASNSPVFNLHKESKLLDSKVVELKIYSPHHELTLSNIMPVLESFGFNVIQEHTYIVNVFEEGKNQNFHKVWIHYFHLNLSSKGEELNFEIKKNFEDAISLIWQNHLVSNPLNRLIITSGLNWKQVYLLNAYSQYLLQVGFRFNYTFLADCLSQNSAITQNLIKLFELKFNPFVAEIASNKTVQKPSEQRISEFSKINQKIENALNAVSDAAQDVLIRKILSLINATLRTNFYQKSDKNCESESSSNSKNLGAICDSANAFKGYVSLKFDSKKVPGLPLPLPNAEIFVYSPRFEAVHLRGGKVARGGLRWSDRQDDFRTEILGLMKAQMTKNAVIVPVGSKGGFVLKRNLLNKNRDEIQQEAIFCYKLFLSGLLDITDNVVNGQVLLPQNVILYDEADPYLVVAADKGTATFSDIANSISAHYNFWLGDAFASGGSVGYDHKKMGITAKGAWISVMRHFREMGIDTQAQDFTCVGIGDLAGDVFGNGMLLSSHTKLVAAFNHLHIFIDPNPDSSQSFLERKRIFNLPRSTWKDYNQSLISKGGGIFERSAKSISISPQIKALLDISDDELSPNDLIRAILKAPVDLLWNGGIGTYVKASDESHLQVGDRANDALRINGNELRCKVVSEGGNLGFTQKGRIEYARKGGKINTDAMDNSAGVDCSDHEVNIKIAITTALKAGKLTLEERNKILESMTDEVSSLVLSDNRLQTQIISITQSRGYQMLGEQSQFLDRIEKSGLLNRAIEFLPSRKEIEKLANEKTGLSRPELSVMLAYAKMEIYGQILGSELVFDAHFRQELFAYFPSIMQKKFSAELENHQLRKEIIATQITNFVVNRIGINFVNQIASDSGFSISEVVKCFIITCEIFDLAQVWQQIEKLDGKIAHETQMQMFLSANKLIERSVLWLLKNRVSGEIEKIVSRFKPIAKKIAEILPFVLSSASRQSFERKINRYCIDRIDLDLAQKVA